MSGENWVVDAHLHLFKKASRDYPRDCESFYPAEREALVEDFLNVMDSNNVKHAVIVPLGTELHYLSEVLQIYPDKFSGIAVLDFDSPNPIADLRRWKKELAIKGIRVMGNLGDASARRFEDLDLAYVLREMSTLGLILWFYGSFEQLKLVNLVARALPELTIVLNHLGFCQQGFSIDKFNRPHIEVDLPPESVHVVESLARFNNVMVKFSGAYGFSKENFPYLDIKPIANRIYKAFGPLRLVWASDWPWIEVNPGYKSLISLTEIFFDQVTDIDRQQIMSGNAQRLFNLNLRCK